MAWSPSHAIGNRVAPSYCSPEYFESEDSTETLPLLEEFLENLADLKIYSTSDFFTLKREEGLPDGIPRRPLRAYPELQGKWSNLWDKVHDIRRARGEKIEERRKQSVEELQAFIMKMVSEDDIEDIPEEEFPEENVNSQEEREQETPQQITEQVRYNSQEKEKLLAMIAENNKITLTEIAEKMSLSKATLNRIIAQFKQEKQLVRVGSSNNGHWKIPREGDTPDHYDSPEERKEKLLAMIAENDKITREEMAKQMSLSTRTIDRTISRINQRNSWLGRHAIIINNGKDP